MHPATYARVEQHLSSEGVFLMGDAKEQGFPIRYASPGFEEVYGYEGSEIAGRKCGDLIGGPFILSHPDVLHSAAETAGLPMEEAEARIRFLNEKAGEACRTMVAHPNQRVGVALLLNRKKSGERFVCECIVICLRHPSLDWAYTVGFQRDITRELPVHELFAACAGHAAYARLLQRRALALEERRAVLLGVGSENVVQYLHGKALSVFSMDIWRTLRTTLLASAPGAPSGRVPPMPEELTAEMLNAMAQVPHDVAPGHGRQELNHLPPQPRQHSRQPQEQAFALNLSAPALQPASGPFSLSLKGAGRRSAPVRGGVAYGDPHLRLKSRSPTAAFLANAGLFQYAEPLLLNGYEDLETLADMEEKDMISIGLPRGHAAKLKKRVRGLRCMQLCAGVGQPLGAGFQAPAAAAGQPCMPAVLGRRGGA